MWIVSFYLLVLKIDNNLMCCREVDIELLMLKVSRAFTLMFLAAFCFFTLYIYIFYNLPTPATDFVFL